MTTATQIALFRDWVLAESLAIQGTLATGVRGPDGCPKEDPAKAIVQAYRWTIMNNAHKGTEIDCPFHNGYEEDGFDCPHDHSRPGKTFRPNHGDTFMGDWTGIAPDVERYAFLKGHDQYPHHWLMHMIHCAEIVGYLHPSTIVRNWWRALYYDFCNAFHMNLETQQQMLDRLQERE